MNTARITKQEDGTIILQVTIPQAAIKKTRTEVIADIVKNTTLPGFRKGMAPQKLVEGKIEPMKLQEDILRKLLPGSYTEAIKEHNLKPVVSPKIHVEKLGEGKDWEFSATTCELPEVTLADYKKKVKDVTAKSKIVVPGKEEQGPNMDEIMKAVMDSVTVTIPHILVETEVERLLAQLLDEIKSLGLSLDQYLASTHKTIEELKKDYEEKAKQDLIFEFSLQKIADDEKINVEQKELEEALQQAKSDAERKNLEANMYLLATILRQQKTLDFLKHL